MLDLQKYFKKIGSLTKRQDFPLSQIQAVNGGSWGKNSGYFRRSDSKSVHFRLAAFRNPDDTWTVCANGFTSSISHGPSDNYEKGNPVVCVPSLACAVEILVEYKNKMENEGPPGFCFTGEKDKFLNRTTISLSAAAAMFGKEGPAAPSPKIDKLGALQQIQIRPRGV